MSARQGRRLSQVKINPWNYQDKVVVSVTVKQNFKKLRLWFMLWQKWQRRILICRIIEHCSNSHLSVLSTSLEPVLHLDYISSLNPLMAALHHEGSQMFKIRRSVHVVTPNNKTATAAGQQLLCTENHALNLLANIKDDTPTKITKLPQIITSQYDTYKSNNTDEQQTVFLPSLPLTHINHKPSPASSDIIKEQTLHLPKIERKFNSVPNIPMAIRTRNQDKSLKQSIRLHNRSMTYQGATKLTVKKPQDNHRKRNLETFKAQLNSLSKWMTESTGQEIVYLLLEVIKLCDKDLIGYLVQCVYQKLQSQFGLNSLTDSILLKIFSYLDARSVCNCSMVCHRWYSLTNSQQIWRGLCAKLGYKEDLGNIVEAIESVHELTQEDDDTESYRLYPNVVIDWKQAYRDLTKLMSKIKALILKKAQALAELADQKKELEYISNLTSAQIRSSMTLREMLDIVRYTSSRTIHSSSTQEVLLSAPESALSQRRQRREQLISAKQQTISEIDSEHSNHKNTLLNYAVDKKNLTVTIIELLEVAIDSRPSIPSLPNPDGIESLVLAGYLSTKDRPRPGRVESLPSMERIAHIGTAVICVQCDERKIVAGCADRLIRVYDIRSGREVSTLSGHKGSVQCLQFDDYKIVSGSWDTTCIVWDVAHFTSLRTLAGHVDCVSSLQFNDTILVSGCYDKTLKIWEVRSWLCVRTISPAHSGPITCLSLTNSNIISGSEDRTVKFWNINNGECQSVLQHSNKLTSLRLSKLLLVTATTDGVLHLWNAKTKALLMERKAEYGDDTQSCIVDVAIDKAKIYAARIDGVIHEWDVATGACIRMIQGHSKALTSIWVGNSKIVSTAEDQTLCVWQPDKFIFQSGEVDSFYSYVPIKTITL